jgi:3-phosphoshikimate 1-carboxyvinyltransferase
MRVLVNPSRLAGSARISGNKSNTIRAVFFGTLAGGRSVIRNPSGGKDSVAAVDVCRNFGAAIECQAGCWTVDGVGPDLRVPGDIVDTRNSGTTLSFALATAALINGFTFLTGDYQIRRRPYGALFDSLRDLGALVISSRGNGLAPVAVRGVLRGGTCRTSGFNSQWVSPLLFAGPLTHDGVAIEIVDEPLERGYVDITIGWLRRQGVAVENQDYRFYKVAGGHAYRPFDEAVPGCWTSAAYPLVAAAITESEVVLDGLDTGDFQRDRSILQALQAAGADVQTEGIPGGGVRVRGGRPLSGFEFDCSDCPDNMPVLAVLGTQAKGKTVLRNIHHARVKETDRPAVMASELAKMGARFDLGEDVLTIHGTPLHGAAIDGHDDHRVVMACAVAALAARGETEIGGAEWVSISFPEFFDVLRTLGADARTA